jgi:hypothetical protein
MPKIIDIKFIVGRRQEAIDAETWAWDRKRSLEAPMISLAKFHYAKWKKEDTRNTASIKEWVHNGLGRIKGDSSKMFINFFEKPETVLKPPAALLNALSEAEIKISKHLWLHKTRPCPEPEISIEKKILNLIEKGWELKGDLTSTNIVIRTSPLFESPNINNNTGWMQTMVKYQKPAVCKDCGKEFESRNKLFSAHLEPPGPHYAAGVEPFDAKLFCESFKKRKEQQGCPTIRFKSLVSSI